MKKSVLLLFLFAALQVSAQEINFIPKVGLNIANTTKLGLGPKVALNIGCDVEFMLTKHFAIEPGIYYSSQGGRGEVSEIVSNNYINIPVFAKGYLYKGLFVEAGPQVGFRLNSDWQEMDMKEFTNTVDFSLGLGVGYQMDWGMMISANYNFGLNSVYNKAYKTILNHEDLGSTHNSVFQINIGWRF